MILTRQNLSDAQNLADCRAEFLKADDSINDWRDRERALANWAEKWGEAAIHAIENPAIDEDELTKANRDTQSAEENADALVEAIRDATSKLEDIAYDDKADENVTKKLEPIIQDLEKATA